MRGRRTITTFFGLIVIFTLLFAHEGHQAITTKGIKMVKGKLTMEPPARKAVGLTTAKVDFRTIENAIRVNGQVTLPFDRQGFASSRIEGTVEKIHTRPGAAVRKGEALAEIQSLQLETMQLEVLQLSNEWRLVQQNLERAKDLGESIVSGREISELEVDLQDKRNAVQTARRKLLALGISESQLEELLEKQYIVRSLSVRAPMDGVIAHADISLGEHIEPTKHLFEINDLSVAWLAAEVPEGLISNVRVGQKIVAQLQALPDHRITGTVSFIGTQVEKETRAIRVWCSLDDSQRILKPGMFGTLEIVLERVENAFAAPMDSIIVDGAERYALVRDKKDGIYIKKNVVLGRTDGNYVEVLEGLYPGDTVITDGNHELSSLYIQETFKVSSEAQRNIGLVLDEVDYREVDRVVRLNATAVTPVGATALASSRLEGKVSSLQTSIARPVRKGDVLAEIESLDLENSQLELIQAHLKAGLLRHQLELLQPLASKGVAPRKELLRLETDLRREESTLQSVRRKLILTGLTDSEIKSALETQKPIRTLGIKSPIDGLVSEISVAIGQVVHNGDALFRVDNLSTIWVEGALFEADAAQILKGAPVFVRLHNRRSQGNVSQISPTFSGGTRVSQIWAAVDNEPHLIPPGMRGEMAIVVGRLEKPVIAVPHEALLHLGATTYAFVQQGKTLAFKRVPVEVGVRGSKYVQIIRGLFPGDRVAVTALHELNNALSAVR